MDLIHCSYNLHQIDTFTAVFLKTTSLFLDIFQKKIWSNLLILGWKTVMLLARHVILMENVLFATKTIWIIIKIKFAIALMTTKWKRRNSTYAKKSNYCVTRWSISRKALMWKSVSVTTTWSSTRSTILIRVSWPAASASTSPTTLLRY